MLIAHVDKASSLRYTSGYSDWVGSHDRVSPVSMLIDATATAGLEFQIPPQVARYASFMFSFIGRGCCKFPCQQTLL